MPRYSPTTEGLTPHGRVGAGATSKVLLAANDAREEVILSVDHETAKVYLALGETAVLGQGPFLREKDPYLRLLTKSAISIITETAGPNEKQKITLTEAKAGTFTLSFGGKTTAAIAFNATKETVEEKLEALSTIGNGNVAVTGEAGGPYTVEFIEALKATDVAELTADGSKLEAEGEGEASIAVETTVPGGVSCVFAEA